MGRLTCGMVKNTCTSTKWTGLSLIVLSRAQPALARSTPGGVSWSPARNARTCGPPSLRIPALLRSMSTPVSPAARWGTRAAGGHTLIVLSRAQPALAHPAPGGGQLVAGEYCSYVWPPKVDACNSPFKVTPRLTCGMVKNTCTSTKWTGLSCTQSGATCTGPDRTGGGQLIAGEQCSYVW